MRPKRSRALMKIADVLRRRASIAARIAKQRKVRARLHVAADTPVALARAPVSGVPIGGSVHKSVNAIVSMAYVCQNVLVADERLARLRWSHR